MDALPTTRRSMVPVRIPKDYSRCGLKSNSRALTNNRGYLRKQGLNRTNRDAFDYGAYFNDILVCFLGYIGVKFLTEHSVVGSILPNHKSPLHGMKKVSNV